MATDPKDTRLESVQETIRETTELQSILLEMTDIYENINRESKLNLRSWRDIGSQTTTLNSLLHKTLEIQGKLGREIVKRKSLHEQINKLETFANVVREKAQLLQSKFSAGEKKAHEDYLKLLNEEKRLSELFDDMSTKAFYGDKAKLSVREALLRVQEKLEKSGSIESRSIALLKEQEKIALRTADNLRGQDKELDKINNKVKFLNEKMYITSDLSSTIGYKTKYFLNSLMKGSGFVAAFILFKELFEYAFKIDKEITSIANGLAVSKTAGEALRNQFANVTLNGIRYSKLLDNTLITIDNQVKAMMQLQEVSGLAILFTEKTLQNQIFLTEQLKLSKEEAVDIQRIGMLNNQTGEETVMNITKQVALFDKEKGIRFSTKNIIQQVAKIQGVLLAQYKASPVLLAQAVLEVNKLGISLDKARGISEGFLDFESSIENQLKAQIISGKQLNFEKVRQLALDGDSAAAASEALKQMGSFNEFTKENVIVRKSLAEAINMSVDDLSDSLRIQELLNKSGFENIQALKEARSVIKDQNLLNQFDADIRLKTGSDVLTQQVSQLSLQDKFNNSIEKLKDLFGTLLSGPFMGILNGFVKLISNASNLKIILSAIGVILALNVGRMVAMAIAAAAANPLAAIGGIAAATAMGYFLTSAVSKANDISKSEPVHDAVINPGGRIEISTPKGKIIPDKDDHLIATPDPDKLLKPKPKVPAEKEMVQKNNIDPDKKMSINIEDLLNKKNLHQRLEQPVEIKKEFISRKEFTINNRINEKNEDNITNRNITPDNKPISETRTVASITGNKEKVSVDTKELENKLDEMIDLLKKGGQVYMDSKRVGSTMGMAYSAFA